MWLEAGIESGKKYAENGIYLFHLKLGILYSEPAQLLAK